MISITISAPLEVSMARPYRIRPDWLDVIGPEHQIADRPRNSDIEPHWVDPAGQAAMIVETVGPSGNKSEENEGKTHRGKNDMGNEQQEIDHAGHAIALITSGIVGHMIDHVRQKEDHREAHRCEHGGAV